jgi:hypothetical protein
MALGGLLCGFGSLLAQWGRDWREDYVPTQIVLLLLTAWLPFLTRFLLCRLQSAKSAIAEMSTAPESTSLWWDHELDSIFGGWPPYLLGLLLVALGMPTLRWSWVPWIGAALYLFYLTFSVLLFVGGVCGWAFLRLLKALSQLSALDLKVLPFAWPQTETGMIHGVLMQVFAGGLLAYFLAVLGIWLSPGGVGFLAHGPVGLWVIPLAVTVVLFFFAIEYFIHVLLARAKRERLRQLSAVLQDKFDQWRETGTKETGEAVSEVMKWRDGIQSERSWPLDLLSMTSVVVGVFIPAAKALRELLG